MNKTLLMVTFDFPPSNAASIQRTLKFAEYLSSWGWTIHVLTAKPSAYTQLDENLVIPEALRSNVHRATALDAHRHLSIAGKHLEISKIPDRWSTWSFFGYQLGKRIVRKFQPDVIWSTYPIAGAHYIAGKLAEKFNLPWIADYRDPMHYMHGDNNSLLYKVQKRIDNKTLTLAKKVVFATAGAAELYQARYPNLLENKIEVIENGFDEKNFALLQQRDDFVSPFEHSKYNLYYSGVLYSDGRDPLPVFEALALLQKNNRINAKNFKLTFQGAGDGAQFHNAIQTLGISELIEFIAPAPFMQALYNMTQADALLLIQDTKFNAQIPGKIYEYLNTKRPIVVKADPCGVTAQLAMQHAQCPVVNSPQHIADELDLLITAGKNISVNRAVSCYTRESKAQELNHLLNTLISKV